MALGPLPQTPADVSLFVENGKYIFRVGEAQSIYVYDRDRPNVSICVDQCSRVWPPIIVAQESSTLSDWTICKRADGFKQWCYRGRPLYTHAGDKPGETSGDGVDGVWHIVTP